MAQAQILFYDYNEGTGVSATNAGSSAPSNNMNMRTGANVPTNLYTADGQGVTGQAGDYAFDLTGNSAGQITSASPINELSSFTIAGWFKLDTGFTATPSRVFVNSNGSAGFQLLASGTDLLSLQVDGGSVASDAVYSTLDDWMFIAVTYDGTLTSDNVEFYVGTLTSGGIVSAGSASMNQGVVGDNTNGFALIGNNTTFNGTRPIDGLVDNFALYGSLVDGSGALSSAEVSDIYSAVVPEPEHVGVVIGASMLAVAVGYRRRKR